MNHPKGYIPRKEPATEDALQARIVAYLRELRAFFRLKTAINPAAGMKLQDWQVRKMKGQGYEAGQPDIIIFGKGVDSAKIGLAIELKKASSSPFKKNGQLKKSDHLENQADWLAFMRELGFVAEFATGEAEAKQLINEYFGI